MIGSVASLSARLSLKIQSAQPRQPHVEHETSRSVGSSRAQKRLSAGKDLRREADRRDESPEAVTNGTVVVHDEDDR
jgi:hypothetical protein